MVFGVMLGLGAAMSQSVSYIFSRLFVLRRKRGVLHLLVVSHVLMGLVSAAMLPLFWRGADMPPPGEYLGWLMSTAGFYLLGQVSLFLVLRRTDASRVAPLLALKVVILAIATVALSGTNLAAMQWTAVGLCVAAAFVLNYTGGALPVWAVVGIVLTCLMYCVSDLSIMRLVRALQPSGQTSSATVMVAVCLSYITCGIAAAVMLPLTGRGVLRDTGYAAPFAAAWLVGMVCMYACFARVGVVYGNIMQSTRGLISIVIGVVLVRLGVRDLETKTAASVLVQRLVAAALMCAAVAMYQFGS